MKTLATFLLLAAIVVLPACSCGKPSECTPGTSACACREGSVCDDGLACGPDNTCAAATVARLSVSDAAARGCEAVLVEERGTTLVRADFKNGAEGAFVRESPKVALSFVAGGDSSLSDGTVELQLVGASPKVTVARSSCVDVNGQKLPGAELSVR